jgi:hypothetical protein
MAEHIPFVYNIKESAVLRKKYSDSVAVRLSLDTLGKVQAHLPSGPLRWLDPAIDGIDRWDRPQSVSDAYKLHISSFSEHDRITDSAFQRAPTKDHVRAFADSVLDRCVDSFQPDWLSVPQLPLAPGSGRNKINRFLAVAASEWRTSRKFSGKFILPAIVTHIKQIKNKTERRKRIELIKRCYELSGAEGYWIVDSSLKDQEGAQPLENVRFPALIDFHQELNKAIVNASISVAGPYWGLNLILWVRGLVRFPAVSLGKSYQYHLPGGKLPPGSERVALPPLKRWAVASNHLESWLLDTLKRVPKTDPAHAEFVEITQNFSHLMTDSREQVATFYKHWFDRLAATPEPGRALALFQDFSSAYVLGKSLRDLPRTEGSGRKPARVAKQFMVNCLSDV